MSSTVLFTYSKYERNEKLSKILFHGTDVPIVVGFASDAFIYVLANRDVRKILFNIFRREQMHRSNRVRDFASALAI